MNRQQFIISCVVGGLLGLTLSSLLPRNPDQRDQDCIAAYGADSSSTFLVFYWRWACSTPSGIRVYPTDNYLNNLKDKRQ